MIKVGIFGGTGYQGGEALRVLLEHPQVEVAWATSRSGGDVAFYHPNLYGMQVNLVHPDKATPCDVIFLALPTAESIEVADNFLQKGCKVIDLGAAFRLKDREIWEAVYDQEHPRWSLVEETVYGITELHLEEIKNTRLVANPGCFTSAAVLGLAPLVKEKLIDTNRIVVDGLSGTTGVGAELSRPAHHPEIGNNLVPYNVVNHRQTFEMEQELSLLAEKPVTIHFTPVYVPIVRGILDICHTHHQEPVNREELLAIYRDFYRDEPFVRVYDLPKEEAVSWQYRPYPWVSSVAGTNYCFIGLEIDQVRRRIVVFSVLDSIGKGGAQSGIENMNVMFDLGRETGLSRRGLHPS
ncbi:MAG TPA: N-acetyl-gamma-glutamyl-phosphate reductase [Dehalococcoidia bacterium]|nr:N-acetyl-gamma-glutamyl-phosphate reductase [Dehalococcoidia bacterium]